MSKSLNSSTSMDKTKAMLRNKKAKMNFLMPKSESSNQKSQVGISKDPIVQDLMSPNLLKAFVYQRPMVYWFIPWRFPKTNWAS